MAEHTALGAAPDALMLQIPDLEATARLAQAIAACLAPGFRLYLSGNLGCGKTEFTRALLRALGHRGRVKSPSYALVEPYNLSKFELYHFDFYRLTDADAWRDAGFEEMLGGDAVSVLEWPEMAAGLPTPDLWLELEFDTAQGETARRLRITPRSERGIRCLEHLRGADSCAEP
jgi:tRNA threonylcarbamoyladenosine biosynthesis protein TsaE